MLLEDFQGRLAAGLADRQCLNDRGWNEVWIAYRREGNEMSAAGKIVHEADCNLNSETRFSDAAWTGDRQQADILTKQEFFGGCNFFFAPHESGALRRNIDLAIFDRANWFFREAMAHGYKFVSEIPG